MKKKIVILLCCCWLLGSRCQSQDLDKTIVVDGRERQYIIHLPPAFNSSGYLPVIFAFHGGGGNFKNTIRFYNLNPLADKYNFIVVYPNAINKAWSMPGIDSRVNKLDKSVDDVKFIALLADTLVDEYKADKNRIFCTGISRGGMLSFYLAYKLPGRFRAIAPVCGGISQTVARNYAFQQTISVLMINGTEDHIVSYSGGTGKFNKKNAENEDADMLPTEDLLSKIVKLNHCQDGPTIANLPDSDQKDDCRAIDYLYSCPGTKIEFIKVVGGGHTWPGGAQYLPKFIVGRVCKDFSASQKIFDFFREF